MLSFQLLGGSALRSDDGPLAGPAVQRRRLALLAVLALSPPRGVSRDKLVAYFWPEEDREHARHFLADSLFTLRKALGKDAVHASGDELGLNPAVVRTDAVEFQDAVARGDPAAAVALYGGPFLDGVFVSDAPEFERWAAAERDRLARLFARALEELATRQEADGDWGGAADWWRRLAAQDPYDARVALRLMRALDASGNRAGALRHARIFEGLLRDELDVDPGTDFLLCVEQLRRAGPVGGSSPAATPVARTTVAPHLATEPTRPPAVAPPEPPTASGGGAESPELPGPPHAALRPRSVWRYAFVGAPLVLLSLGAFLAAARSGPRDVLVVGSAIVVADFANRTPDSTLALVVTEALRTDLSQSRVVRLAHPEAVQAALRRMQRPPEAPLDERTAREVARREGLKAVLVGEVGAAGSGFVLSARLVTADSGTVLAAARETAADSSALLTAIDRLSAHLRARVGEPLAAIRAGPPLEQATTPSLEALTRYTQAVRLDRQGARERALVLLEEATALDTAFSSAYRKLGVLHSLIGDRDRSVAALERAYRHRARLTDRERYATEGTYHRLVTRDRAAALAAFETLAELYPDDWRTLDNLVVLYIAAGDLARADAAGRRELALDSSLTWVYEIAVWVQFARGMDRDADATLAAYQRRVPHAPAQWWLHARVASYRGDYDSVAAVVSGMTGYQAHLWRSALAERRGRFGEAARHLRTAEGATGSLHGAFDGFQLALMSAHLGLARGRPAAALAAADRVWPDARRAESFYGQPPYHALAVVYARAGRPDRAREALAEFEAAATPAERQAVAQHRRYALAFILLAEGRGTDAVREFRAWRDAPSCLGCVGHPELGRAYELTGQRDSAVAVYERFLHTPNATRVPSAGGFLDSPTDQQWEAPVLERLAALYDAGGDRVRAAAAYAAFVEQWSEADPPLQPRVARARDRLAVLRASRASPH